MRLWLQEWKKLFKINKQKGRIAAYTRNSLHRLKIQNLFREWREYGHKRFKMRLDIEKE
jgi:hypothetical protein